MYRIGTALSLLACAVFSSSALSADNDQLIQCGTLLDVENKQSLSNQQILVKNDLIADIGAAVDASAYAIDLDARHTLIGDSSGGHYVLRDLYDDKSPFSRSICISPGFNSAPGSIKALEAEYAAKHKDMEVDLFLCSGEIEIDATPLYGLVNFGSGILWVAEQFAVRNYPSAEVHWEIMNKEDHGSIAPRAISTGLRSVHRMRPGVHGSMIEEQTKNMMKAGAEG